MTVKLLTDNTYDLQKIKIIGYNGKILYYGTKSKLPREYYPVFMDFFTAESDILTIYL